ncbi:YciI family protein [Nonomuraea aurantiaca]|uniref:YciI family protein n=1 Tax=Nonomuraea aurantiaca TaxID=2878562 RepID=UPI001CD957D6|nr:YciI family protein [Nonomuraea aurantiaca]MCA2225930.1 YciI family protein [Nonomuraea aurantiaca]
MRYALLINERPGAYEGLSEDQRAAISAEYIALMKDERMLGGERLQPADTATTVRVQNGEPLLTDGPFADTKEIFGGFYIVEASDLDSALELAARIPAARFGGSVEVRPLVEL